MTSVKQPTWWKSSPCLLRLGNRRGASLYDVGWKPHNRRHRAVFLKKKFKIFQNRFDKSPINTNNNHNNFHNFLTSINRWNSRLKSKKLKKKQKNRVNNGILEKKICRIPSGMAQELHYAISRNFHFWSVSIQAFYQKLWPFEVFSSKKFWNPKSMIHTSRKHSKHTKIRKHTSCR